MITLFELFLLLGDFLEEYFPEYFGDLSSKEVEIIQGREGITVFAVFPFHRQALFSIPAYLQD